MNRSSVPRVLPASPLAAVALLALVASGCGPSRVITERVPGQDRVESDSGAAGSSNKWEGRRVQGPGIAPVNYSGTWPWFRGPELSGISAEKMTLATSWPAGGPPALWKLEVGEGFAAPAVVKGRVYFTDYDHTNKADALRCLSLADGQEIWRYTYPVRVKRNHGMSRTIPAVAGTNVISLGPKCHVICVDAQSGELRWRMDLVQEFNTEVPPWYAGQCPLVDGDRLVLGTGGDALVVAVEVASGKVLWKSPNPSKWQMTHSSITPLTFKGRRMYVYCASGGVAGVSAEDGQILWETPDWKISMANIPSPVHVGEGRIFLSGGYNAGSMMIQLEENDGRLMPRTLFRLKPNVFGSTQQTPILFQDHILGVRPDGQFACLDLSGKPVWESGAANRYGLGPYMIAQSLLLVMNDDGLLTLAEASTTGFKKLAQARVLEGPDAWGPLALADGRLIVRDMNRMVCLDVAAK